MIAGRIDHAACGLVSRQARNVGLSRRTQAAAQGANHSDTQRYREDLQRSDGACGQARERHFWLDATLGTYNPDWAVLVTTPDGDKLYFVVETKSSLLIDDLRRIEADKIKCGAAHFKALAVGENPAVYGKFKDVAGLLGAVTT